MTLIDKMEKQYTIKDTVINCRIQGEGKPLLLLHGWGGNADSFLPVARDFTPKRRVYTLEFPGFGQSPAPKVPWTIYDYADATAEFMDQEGLNGCDIIAHSFGGRVSILLGAKRPDLVGKLVLTGAAGLIKKRTMKYYYKVYTYKIAKWFLKTFAPRKLEAMQKKAGSADYRALPQSMKKTFINVVNEDLKGYLKSIKASTLLLWGKDDQDTPLYFGEIMEREIPDAGLVTLKGGHFAYLDSFGEFMRIAQVFLNQ